MAGGRRKETHSKKKKNETHTLGDRIPHTPGVNNSAPAYHYTKEQLGAVIFGCKHETMDECLRNLLFGLPIRHFSYIKNIESGLPIFLFNYNGRKLHGIYEATSHGRLNINPHAWTNNGSNQTQFPAQVRVRIRKQCKSLSEEQYKKVLEKNYMDELCFRFELDHRQTAQLLYLFESSSATSPYNAPIRKPLQRSAPRNEDRLKLTSDDSASAEFFNEASAVGAEFTLPTTRTWASLFEETHGSDAKPSTSWEEAGTSYVVSGWGEVEGPCWTDNPHVEDEHSPIAPLVSGGNQDSEEQTEGDLFSCGTDDSISENYEDASSYLFDPQYEIDQLMQELNEVKAFSMDQHRKTCALEKQLVDTRIELKQFRDRVAFLESQFRKSLMS
ncbi:hypothetical protein IFM89_019040, partial [Coptis chinensis]